MTVDMGTASVVDAETFGTPGRRTFRLRILNAALECASLWMEKEQFQALSMALEQALLEIEYHGPPADMPVETLPQVAEHDFKVGRMAISLDTADRTLTLHAYDSEAGEESDPTMRASMTAAQCAALRPRIDSIVRAGRPVCPLCSQPLDASGHACIRANGHLKLPIPEEDGDEEQT